MNFGDALKAQFDANPDWKTRHPRLWQIVNSKETARKRRRLKRMEEEVYAKFGKTEINWPDLSQIDWLRVVQWIAAILTILLLI